MKTIDLSMYEGSLSGLKPNYTQIPVNRLDTNEEGAEEFNRIYKWITLNQHNFFPITRTPSGGICKKNFKIPSFDVQVTNTSVEITLCLAEKDYRFLFRTGYKNEGGPGVSGREGFNKFREICQNHGINLDDYAIENGEEVKETIEKLHIGLENQEYKGIVYSKVNHIDLNSAFMSGIMTAFPDLEAPIREIYNKRKIEPVCKGILNTSQGYMQSEYCRINGKRFALSHLSKAGIAYCNRYVESLAKKLKESGRKVLAYNTDGIWYQGEIFEDETQGKDLCQWKNDHINCIIRFKSDGAYEFIENGEYYPVVRGYTKYDRIKPRTEWQWGDIFRNDCDAIIFKFSYEDGIIL